MLLLSMSLKRNMYSLFSRKFSHAFTPDVILTEYNSCGIITLNRQKALNTLTLPMIHRITEALTKWSDDSSISHIIFEGAGEKAFCAGGDIRIAAEAVKKNLSLADIFEFEYKMDHMIATSKKPCIALISGVVMGGGAGLSVHGPYRVATETTLFAMPETAIGLFTDVGSGHFFSNLKQPGLAAYLALTGSRLQGIDVVWSGLATHFIDSKKLTSLKEDLLDLNLGDNPPPIDQQIRESLKAGCSATTTDDQLDPPSHLAPHLDHMARIFSLFDVKDRRVTMEEIMQKLSDLSYQSAVSSRWADGCLQALNQMSPTSLKVTLRYLQECANLPLADVFRLDYRLGPRMTVAPDFCEGVRALLEDKDNKPRWQPNSLASVTDSAVDQFFAPLLPEAAEWQP